MYKKLNEMLREGYLETKLQDEVAASLEVNEASGEDMGIDKSKAKEGVYILHVNGQLYNVDSWNSGSRDAVGVALIAKKCKFVIAPKGFLAIPWNKNFSAVPGCYRMDLNVCAETDFGGESNTKAIVDFYKHSNTKYAALLCSQYQFKNGKKGYLGAVGEIKAIYAKVKDINKALSKIDGTRFNTYYGANGFLQWTSSQNSGKEAWFVNFDRGNIGYTHKDNKDSNMGCRPLCAL